MSLKALKNPLRSKCCVKGCSTRVCSGVKMHGFPRVDRYPELYQHWVDAVRLANKTPLWVPLKSNKVCAFHFETVQNTRIRVPTVFPNSEGQAPSASWEQSYDDFDGEGDPTADDYEEDPLDAYEDSIAANTVMAEDGSTLPYVHIENTDAVGYIDEGSSTTYDDIEERYNTIVGDVVSTLVTDDCLMDEDTNITYEDVEDGPAPTCNNEVEEEGTAVYNNVEEEIVYDDGDYMFNDEENPTIRAQTFSAEQIGLNQKELGDNDYCVLVIRREPDDTKPESTKELSPSKSEVHSQSTQKSACKKSSKKGPCYKSSGKMTIKAAKPLPSSLKSSSACGPSEESAIVPKESTISLSEEVRELLLKGQEILHNETDSVKLQEHEASSQKTRVKSPSKKGRLKSPSKIGKMKPKETLNTTKSPDKQEEQKTSPSKGKEEETSPTEEFPVEPEEQKMSPCKGKETETSPPEEFPVEPEVHKASPSKGKDTETSPTEKFPVEPEEQKASPSKDEEKETASKSASSKSKKFNGIKIGDLLLDGQPIKLKECSVNMLRTPTKPKSKKKVQSASKVKNTIDIKGGTEEIEKVEKKEMVPSGNIEDNNFEKDDELLPGSSLDFLNALSLKTSQEDENSGLRRSARIRAGAGKRTKFGIRRSWSVAFKDPPKKKLKVEIDETSQSSESVPYDFENEEDDPDIGVSDLEGSDTSASEAESESQSDFSSRSVRTSQKCERSRPQPTLNGVTKKRRVGRLPYSATADGEMRPKFHGYQRVRLGDQATQVGLPGKCDGFIFDVVRDDPHNVGVSCNVFYHYQPKNYRHHSTWARLKRNMDTPSTAATKIITAPLISIANRKIDPTNKHAQKTVESKDTAHERQSKDDKKRTVKKSKNSTQKKNLECGAASNNHLADSGELIEVVENAHEKENVDSGKTEFLGETESPENDYILGGIKVEPAMDVPPSMGDVDGHLTGNVDTDGKSQTPADINSMGNTAEFAELKIKEEEEFHDVDTEMVRVDQGSCIASHLREVSHNDAENAGGATDSCNTLSEPGVAHRDEVTSESMDADDSTIAESHAVQGCSVKTAEHNAEHYVDDNKTENFAEAMDTSADQADSGNSSERTETFMEYPRITLASSLKKPELPFAARAKDIAALCMPNSDRSSDSGSEADSLLEDDNMVVNKGSEPVFQNLASDSAEEVVANEPMGVECSNKFNEHDTENAAVTNPAKSTKSPSEAEISGSRKDVENIEKSNDSNTSIGPEHAAECSGGLPNFELSLKTPSEAVSCDPKDAENVERFDVSGSVRGEPGCEAECQNDAGKSYSGEGQNEVGECPNATADPAMSAVDDQTSGNSANTENIKESTDSSNILAQPGCEAECQNDAEKHSGEGQNGVDDRPNSPNFSSDDSSDSLIEVPIPDVDTDVEFVPEINEGTTEKLPQRSKFRTAENPFVENKSNHEKCHQQNLAKSPDLETPCEVPVADSPKTVPNEDGQSAEEENPVQCESSQEVFDSIERNLEKMFEMDR